MIFKDFESYLRSECQNGAIDFKVRLVVSRKGEISFYIHPLGKDGETRDFAVKGNTLQTIANTSRCMLVVD